MVGRSGVARAMSDEQKRKVNRNVTIQIDLNQVELVDPNVPQASTPPPLPAALPAAAEQPAGPQSPRKTIAYVAMIVALVGVAIAGGLAVGRGCGDTEPTASSAVAAPPAGSQAPSVASGRAASSTEHTLTLPTVEMK